MGSYSSKSNRAEAHLNGYMWVNEIWRYPVKSMAGELLTKADLNQSGVTSDRIIHVRDLKGRIVTARTRRALLRHGPVLNSEGEVLVDGRPWNSPEVARDVEAAAGHGTYLTPSEQDRRFDILPLLIATDGMIAAVGHDRRRFRPNLVIGGVPGLSERDCENAQLRIGAVLIGLEDLRTRCIMTPSIPIPVCRT